MRRYSGHLRPVPAAIRRREGQTGLRPAADLFSWLTLLLLAAAIALHAAVSPGVDRLTTSAYGAPPPPILTSPGRAMPVCGYSKRINCVVDGDTFWLNGEKIRISNIDAPEVEARCDRERRLARNATLQLAALLRNRPVRLDRVGTDRFGRTLAQVSTDEGNVGDALVARELAVYWHGRREPAETWCEY